MIDRQDAVQDASQTGQPAANNFADTLAALSSRPNEERLEPMGLASARSALSPVDILLQKIDEINKPAEVSRASDKPFQRYETDQILDAVKDAQAKGLPLVVQIGASWCPHCQAMEKVWPGVEGSATAQGSMQGKAVFLHLDWDQAEKLTGTSAQLADILKEGVKGFPTFKVFSIDNQNKITLNALQVGQMSQTQLEAVIVKGGAKK